MALPKVSQKTALFIVVPVILAMLAWGVVTWPSEEDQKKYQERKQFKADSLEALKTSFAPVGLTPETRGGYLDKNEELANIPD